MCSDIFVDICVVEVVDIVGLMLIVVIIVVASGGLVVTVDVVVFDVVTVDVVFLANVVKNDAVGDAGVRLYPYVFLLE